MGQQQHIFREQNQGPRLLTGQHLMAEELSLKPMTELLGLAFSVALTICMSVSGAGCPSRISCAPKNQCRLQPHRHETFRSLPVLDYVWQDEEKPPKKNHKFASQKVHVCPVCGASLHGKAMPVAMSLQAPGTQPQLQLNT